MRTHLDGAVICVAVLTGCSADDPRAEPPDRRSTSAAPVTALPASDEPVTLDPSDFTADVTNPWFPLCAFRAAQRIDAKTPAVHFRVSPVCRDAAGLANAGILRTLTVEQR